MQQESDQEKKLEELLSSMREDGSLATLVQKWNLVDYSAK